MRKKSRCVSQLFTPVRACLFSPFINFAANFKAVLVAAAGWGSYVSGRQETKMTGLMLDNVEALATGEDANLVFCWGIGSVDCPTTHRKVYVVRESYSLE